MLYLCLLVALSDWLLIYHHLPTEGDISGILNFCMWGDWEFNEFRPWGIPWESKSTSRDYGIKLGRVFQGPGSRHMLPCVLDPRR